VTSPYGNQDWYEERQSWKWINTVMRVNSLVQKVSKGLDVADHRLLFWFM
jgi:hypothetical protein